MAPNLSPVTSDSSYTKAKIPEQSPSPEAPDSQEAGAREAEILKAKDEDRTSPDGDGVWAPPDTEIPQVVPEVPVPWPEASTDPERMDDQASDMEEDSLFSLSDDELWDEEGDLADISLFEKELEQGTFETDAAAAGGDAKQSVGDGEPPREGDTLATPKTEGAEAEASSTDELSAAGESKPLEQPWLPWAAAGVAAVFLVAGLLVLWHLIAPQIQNQVLKGTGMARTGAASQYAVGLGDGLQEIRIGPGGQAEPAERSRLLPALEIITLDPFLIPAQQSGELVFLKAQVELLVQGQGTLRKIKRKETWVRDLIYQELKGIDIKPAIQGDFLQQFRRPIQDTLNQELAPLKVSEVKLMGFLLK